MANLKESFTTLKKITMWKKQLGPSDVALLLKLQCRVGCMIFKHLFCQIPHSLLCTLRLLIKLFEIIFLLSSSAT
jgi:hypothetical protein